MPRRRHFLVLALTLVAACKARSAAPTATGEIIARRASALPTTDPAAAAWASAPVTTITLQPQDLVEPKLVEPGVTALEVRALHDDKTIAFQLRWADATADVLAAPGRFSDAAAVELPAELTADPPDPAMGMRDRAVDISYWKAAWQETADPVAALRPNMPPIAYPFEAATGAKRDALALQYAPARAVGNPLTTHTGAVQDLRAEGAGTITAMKDGRSVGKGAFATGGWTLVIARPLPAGATAAAAPRLSAGFAVWDGGRGQVGAKKMRSVWIPISLERAP